MKKQVIREVIPTHSGSKENRYFFLTLLGVVLLAIILLWATVHKHNVVERLPNQLSNLATQLSIASDEIAMLQDVGLLSQEPTLSELHDNQLEPFMSESMIAASNNCFVAIKQDVVIRLIKLPELNWLVQWRSHPKQNNHAHDSEQQKHYAGYCQNDSTWLASTYVNSEILDSE